MLSWQSNNQRSEFRDSKCRWRGLYFCRLVVDPLSLQSLGLLSLLSRKSLCFSLYISSSLLFIYYLVADFVEEKQKAISLFAQKKSWVLAENTDKRRKEIKVWVLIIREELALASLRKLEKGLFGGLKISWKWFSCLTFSLLRKRRWKKELGRKSDKGHA